MPSMFGYWRMSLPSEEFAKNQVINFYQKNKLVPAYLREMGATLWHHSRVGTSIALETLFVYEHARGLDKSLKEALYAAGLMKNAVKIASIKDQWQDDIYVKNEASSGRSVDVNSIKEETLDKSWTPDILSKRIPMTVSKPRKVGPFNLPSELPSAIKETKRTFDHAVYFRAAKILQEVVVDGLSYNPLALDAFIEGESFTGEYQAIDLAVAICMYRGDIEGAQKNLNAYDYENAVVVCQDNVDKLGKVGGYAPVISLEMAWRSGENKEAIRRELYNVGRNVTRFEQIVSDDVPSLMNDLEQRSPNMILLPAIIGGGLTEYNQRDILGEVKKHDDVMTGLLSSISDEMHTNANELYKLRFAGIEARKTVQRVVNKGMEKIHRLEKQLDMRFDGRWYQEAKEREINW